jgi:hypothetical protein
MRCLAGDGRLILSGKSFFWLIALEFLLLMMLVIVLVIPQGVVLVLVPVLVLVLVLDVLTM